MKRYALLTPIAVILCLSAFGCQNRKYWREDKQLEYRSDMLMMRARAADLRSQAAAKRHKAMDLDAQVANIHESIEKVELERQSCLEEIERVEDSGAMDARRRLTALRARLGQCKQMHWYYSDLKAETAQQASFYRHNARKTDQRAAELEKKADKYQAKIKEMELARAFRRDVDSGQVERASFEEQARARDDKAPETTFTKAPPAEKPKDAATTEEAKSTEEGASEEKKADTEAEKNPETEEEKPETP